MPQRTDSFSEGSLFGQIEVGRFEGFLVAAAWELTNGLAVHQRGSLFVTGAMLGFGVAIALLVAARRVRDAIPRTLLSAAAVFMLIETLFFYGYMQKWLAL